MQSPSSDFNHTGGFRYESVSECRGCACVHACVRACVRVCVLQVCVRTECERTCASRCVSRSVFCVVAFLCLFLMSVSLCLPFLRPCKPRLYYSINHDLCIIYISNEFYHSINHELYQIYESRALSLGKSQALINELYHSINHDFYHPIMYKLKCMEARGDR